MKEFQEILAAVLWRMSCENSLACNTLVLQLRNFIILSATFIALQLPRPLSYI